MSRYEISLDVSQYELLDQFALLACQGYNLGNKSAWFNVFRGGLYGFHARLDGFVTHYNVLHAWIQIPRTPSETEHHLASVFFCMDSAIECITFALNALGYAYLPNQFRDVTNERALRQISPKDILGEYSKLSSRLPLPGYKAIFPNLQNYWQTKRSMLILIMEHHDVSKHRETIFTGGKVRDDPPPGFYESIGIKDKEEVGWMYAPMAEIILRNNPKSAFVDRPPQESKDFILLENIAEEFVDF